VGLEVHLVQKRDLHDQRELQRGDEGEIGRHQREPEEAGDRAAGGCPHLLGVGQPLRQLGRAGARVLAADIVHAPSAAGDLAHIDAPEAFLGEAEHEGILTRLRRPGRAVYAGEQTWRRMSSSSSAFPAPMTTELSGSSARKTGRPVSSRKSASRFFSNAPPPASTMPRSAMSPASSGGVRSRVTLTASTMALTGSASASRISSELTVSVRGTPATRSRPLMSIVRTSSVG